MAKAFQEFGKHYLVEFIGCDPKKLKTVKVLKAPFLEAARLSGATMRGSQFHQFKPQGVTAMIFIAESHFSLHTWPEHKYAAFDVLTCGVMEPEWAIAHLKKFFKAKSVEVRILSRGFGSAANLPQLPKLAPYGSSVAGGTFRQRDPSQAADLAKQN